MATALLVGAPFRIAIWGHAVLACTPYRQPDSFLAYCTSDQYGDYEHGAYFFDLEPAAVENLRKAQVLFLGGSRPQYGFSTDAIKRYFVARSIPYYVMGFGYSDGRVFAAALIERYHLRPKFVVISADPFFKGFLSEPGRELLQPDVSSWLRPLLRAQTWLDYATRKAFNVLQPDICKLASFLCVSSEGTIYRSERDGSWITETYAAARQPGRPIIAKKIVPLDPRPLPGEVEDAERLSALLALPKACIALTVVPNNALDAEPYAAEIGRQLGVPVLLPRLEGLTTFDASHLTRDSAERWSAEITRELDPLMAPCLVPP
jgi:hypothetical protein